jgi:hypothetical protein
MEYLIFVAIVCISTWGYRRIKWLQYSQQDFWDSCMGSGVIVWIICGVVDIILVLILLGVVVYFGGQLIKWIAL